MQKLSGRDFHLLRSQPIVNGCHGSTPHQLPRTDIGYTHCYNYGWFVQVAVAHNSWLAAVTVRGVAPQHQVEQTYSPHLTSIGPKIFDLMIDLLWSWYDWLFEARLGVFLRQHIETLWICKRPAACCVVTEHPGWRPQLRSCQNQSLAYSAPLQGRWKTGTWDSKWKTLGLRNRCGFLSLTYQLTSLIIQLDHIRSHSVLIG